VTRGVALEVHVVEEQQQKLVHIHLCGWNKHDEYIRYKYTKE
jgi:hypothetical protein